MKQEIVLAANHANGKRRDRTINESDMIAFQELLERYEKNELVRNIRVYSHEGFVPNSYKWRVEISVLQANRNTESGEWVISGFTVDAKRSYGNGALVTINGKAA